MDIFTIPTSPFNAQIRIQKKLLGIMRFSEGLKTEILGTLFRYFARFLVIRSMFIQTNGLFHKKRLVVRSISRDIFQIISDEFFISSEIISISSEKFRKSLRMRARFLGQMILNSRGVHSILPRSLKIQTKIRPVF
nr:MAG TPA: hypothetical protein [Bacteriophage sp.]